MGVEQDNVVQITCDADVEQEFFGGAETRGYPATALPLRPNAPTGRLGGSRTRRLDHPARLREIEKLKVKQEKQIDIQWGHRVMPSGLTATLDHFPKMVETIEESTEPIIKHWKTSIVIWSMETPRHYRQGQEDRMKQKKRSYGKVMLVSDVHIPREIERIGRDLLDSVRKDGRRLEKKKKVANMEASLGK